MAGWGAYLSVRSAASGPEWALGHLAGVRPWVAGGVGIGVFVSIAIRPIWIGLAIVYVAATAMLLSVLVRRSLLRLAASGGLEALPLDRRIEIVGRAKRLFWIAGGLLAVIGIAGVAIGAGVVGWITGALGVTLIGTASAIDAHDVRDVGDA